MGRWGGENWLEGVFYQHSSINCFSQCQLSNSIALGHFSSGLQCIMNGEKREEGAMEKKGGRGHDQEKLTVKWQLYALLR